jgi:protein gp37
MAKRLQAMGQPNYRDGFKVTMHEDVLKAPFGWRRPSMVFVNSMSDLFHKDVPVYFTQKAFEVMRSLPQHHFQILTKRAERLAELSRLLPWARNIWMGVSVENRDYMQRIDILRQTEASVKFLSIEPLLGPISGLDLTGIDWVIVGGESGPRARPMKEEWVTEIRDQCLDAGVAFFFKQWGGTNKKRTGRTLEGRIWDEMPRAAA